MGKIAGVALAAAVGVIAGVALVKGRSGRNGASAPAKYVERPLESRLSAPGPDTDVEIQRSSHAGSPVADPSDMDDPPTPATRLA
jgi:hypothetical protein